MTGRNPFGLVLGGGGLLGFCHIGVLEVLEEEGLVPDLVVGTSAGGLVAGLYAAGLSAAELREVALKVKREDLFEWGLTPLSFLRLLLGSLRDLARAFEATPSGIFRGERLKELVEGLVGVKRLEDLDIPFGAVAVDLITAQRVVFSSLRFPAPPGTLVIDSASLGTAVQATAALPGLFPPVPYQGLLLADGGLADVLPVAVARLFGARVVVAVRLGVQDARQEPQGFVQVLLRSLEVQSQWHAGQAAAEADLVISVVVPGLGLGDFGRIPELLQRGREAARSHLAQLKELLRV